MNGWVVGAYVVVLGGLVAYALYLRARRRALERQLDRAGGILDATEGE